jgi:hypothetical protein
VLARVDLALEQEQFERLSPRRLVEMLKRCATLREHATKEANLRTGLLASVIAVIANGLGAKMPTDPHAWFGGDDAGRYLSDEDTVAVVKAWADAHNRKLSSGHPNP